MKNAENASKPATKGVKAQNWRPSIKTRTVGVIFCRPSTHLAEARQLLSVCAPRPDLKAANPMFWQPLGHEVLATPPKQPSWVRRRKNMRTNFMHKAILHACWQ
jgi:hypothetical protein